MTRLSLSTASDEAVIKPYEPEEHYSEKRGLGGSGQRSIQAYFAPNEPQRDLKILGVDCVRQQGQIKSTEHRYGPFVDDFCHQS